MISDVRKRFLILFFSVAVAAISVASQEAPKKAAPPAAPPAQSTPATAPQSTPTAAPPAARVTVRPSQAALPNIKYEKYALANGLEVILSEDHRLPLVSTDLWYHVGPANELPGRTGFAHLFEHMMFEGSKHVPGNAHIR